MPIYLGYQPQEELAIVAAYRAAHAIRKVVVIAPPRFPLLVPEGDQVAYADVIMYVTFYRLLQEIDRDTLIVLHECLRTQNRYDLAYNCIRNYLNQTSHVLVFQALPQIDTAEDFMILFDLATGSRWKRRHFDAALVHGEAELHVRPHPATFERLDVPSTSATRSRYARERARLFAELGARDPHTLPRNLYLIGGRDKLAYLEQRLPAQPSLLPRPDSGGAGYCVARNRRLNRPEIVPYEAANLGHAPYLVLELPHRFLDWCDFVAYTGQVCHRVLVADLKVDEWYFQRYTAWGERLNATYASLSA